MTIKKAETARRVRLSLDLTPELHATLKVAAARRKMTMSKLLRHLLENALNALGEPPATSEDLDSLDVRRELAAASVAALGDSWDTEVDAAWQDYQP